MSIRFRASALALSGALSGCFSGLPEGALDPVDCSTLPVAPDGLVEQIERGNVVLTDGDVSPGTAQVVVTIDDDESGLRWYAPPERADSEIVWSPRSTWATKVMLDCRPEAAVFVHFKPPDGTGPPLVPGDYPVDIVSMDVPDREQGADSGEGEFGHVTITAVADGWASGYWQDGGAGGVLYSHLTQEDLPLEFTVEALAFRAYSLWE